MHVISHHSICLRVNMTVSILHSRQQLWTNINMASF
jgi:hypothetical protein